MTRQSQILILLFWRKLSVAMIVISLGRLCSNYNKSNFCLVPGAGAFITVSHRSKNHKPFLMSSKTELLSRGSCWIYGSSRSLLSSSIRGRNTATRRIGANTVLKMWGESPQQGGTSFQINNQQNAYQSNSRPKNSNYNNKNTEDKEGSSFGGGGGGWDDFDVRSPQPQVENTGKGNKHSKKNFYDRKSWTNDNNKKATSQMRKRYQDDSYVGTGKKRSNIKDDNEEDVTQEKRINMRALEMAGFVHLYGISPVLNALAASRRFHVLINDEDELNDRLKELTNGEEILTTDITNTNSVMERKPEAQFASWLFIQEPQSTKTTGTSSTKRNASKVRATQEIVSLAKKRGIPIAYVDKGVLNSLVSGFGSSMNSSPRPHQGFVLRCGSLDFVNYDIMDPTNHFRIDPTRDDIIQLWVALDEVVDPQNLGALLRSIYFFSNTNAKKVGVLVCAKNSAPLSPAVSAASAGALELMTVYSTNNLPKSLTKAKQNGWRILGAAASAGTVEKDNEQEEIVECRDLMEINPSSQPTILVLGNEGSGLRTLVSKCCTGFVRIPGGNSQYYSENDEASNDSSIGVDSLNVSVTGGILLWHFMSSQ